MADAKEIEQTAMIDREMDQVFDWAKGNSMPIRDAIWDHEMEANNHDTMKTEAACEWMLKADDDKIKDYCEKNLKKKLKYSVSLNNFVCFKLTKF